MSKMKEHLSRLDYYDGFYAGMKEGTKPRPAYDCLECLDCGFQFPIPTAVKYDMEAEDKCPKCSSKNVHLSN